MNIDIINNIEKAYGLKITKNSRKSNSMNDLETEKKTSKSDTLEISGDVKKINLIQSKLKSNYYNNNDVIKEIAKRLIEYQEI